MNRAYQSWRPFAACSRVLAALSIASVVWGLACATTPTRVGPPARRGEAVTGWTEDLRLKPGRELYLRNNTENPLRITSVTLFECENIRGGCHQFELDIVLRPMEARPVRLVEPADTYLPWRFRWRWGWTAVRDTSSWARPPT